MIGLRSNHPDETHEWLPQLPFHCDRGLWHYPRTRTLTARLFGGTTSCSGASRCRGANQLNSTPALRARTEPPLRSRRVRIVERCGDPDLQVAAARDRSDSGSRDRSVQPHRLHDRRNDDLSRISGRSKDDDHQARGCLGRIGDRFDLTLECIRRHYLGENSPLGATIARYSDFFGLFGDFAGYVAFFLLQDLVDEDALTVKFSMPFDDFAGSPVPPSLDAYVDYRRRAIEFIEARNRRIAAYAGADNPAAPRAERS